MGFGFSKYVSETFIGQLLYNWSDRAGSADRNREWWSLPWESEMTLKRVHHEAWMTHTRLIVTSRKEKAFQDSPLIVFLNDCTMCRGPHVIPF